MQLISKEISAGSGNTIAAIIEGVQLIRKFMEEFARDFEDKIAPTLYSDSR